MSHKACKRCCFHAVQDPTVALANEPRLVNVGTVSLNTALNVVQLLVSNIETFSEKDCKSYLGCYETETGSRQSSALQSMALNP